jgi:hypothetical protein
MRRLLTWPTPISAATWLDGYQAFRRQRPVQISTAADYPYFNAWHNRPAYPQSGFSELALWGWLPPKPAGTYRMEFLFRSYWLNPVASWLLRSPWDLDGVRVAGPSGTYKVRLSPLWRTWPYSKMLRISVVDWWRGPPAGWVTDGLSHGFSTLAGVQVRYTY